MSSSPGSAPGPRRPGTTLLVTVGIAAAAIVIGVGAAIFLLLGGDSPEEVVEKVYESTACSEERELATDDYAREYQLDDADSDYCTTYNDFRYDVEVGDAEVDGDRAEVPVDVTVDPDEGESYDLTGTFVLDKVDGDWLVSETQLDETD